MKRRRVLQIAFGILWILAVGAGMGTVWNYALTPIISAKPPLRWPDDAPIRRAIGRATLVMLVHPRCPCSRASIRELAVLMARCPDRLAAYLLFYKPASFAAEWAQTDVWHSAAAIPGVTVLLDEDGRAARRFRATISGQAVLYDAQGQMRFVGGITYSRGHSGDNAGRAAIVSLLTTGNAEQTETFVFGCSVFDAN